MKVSKTQKIGNRTFGVGALQLSRTAVANKDPKFDYSFRKKDQANVEIAGQQGWLPVNAITENGETWASPVAVHAIKGKGKGEIHLEDTMLFKRPKAASAFYKQIEDTKYNAQIVLINEAAARSTAPLRRMDKTSVINDQSTKFSQRIGVNDEMGDDIFS